MNERCEFCPKWRLAADCNFPVVVAVNFTKQQLAWARSHDWFVSGNSWEILCRDESVKDGQLHTATVTHTNFQTLREWAGY